MNGWMERWKAGWMDGWTDSQITYGFKELSKPKAIIRIKLRSLIQMLEIPDREFTVIMIDMLSALVEKVNNMQEQVGNVSREIERPRNQKKIMQIKNPVKEMYTVFDGFINKVHKAERKMSDLEYRSIRTSRPKC